MMMPGSKGQKAVHACMIRLLNADREAIAFNEQVAKRIANVLFTLNYNPKIASVIWITRLFSLTSWTRTKEHPFITPITLVAKVPSTR